MFTPIIVLLRPLWIYITNPSAIKENPKNFSATLFSVVMGIVLLYKPGFNQAGEYTELLSTASYVLVMIGLMLYGYFSRKMNVPEKS